jgi:hypothetical protein
MVELAPISGEYAKRTAPGIIPVVILEPVAKARGGRTPRA